MYIINTYNTISGQNGWHTIPKENIKLTVTSNTLDGLFSHSKQITHPSWTAAYYPNNKVLYFQVDNQITIQHSTFTQFSIEHIELTRYIRESKINSLLDENLYNRTRK